MRVSPNKSKSQATTPDFAPWLEQVTPEYDWQAAHLQLIRQHLAQVTDGTLGRLALFLPPRHGKSAMTTVRYVAWRIECDPALRVIVGAYNQELAEHFSRQIRRIVLERGIPLATDRNTASEWQTLHGGGVKAAGVGSGVTGFGAGLIVVDDPVKSREEANSAAYRNRCWDWYTNDLYTRLEPNGAIILIMTLWHEDDLAGRILDSPQAADWAVVSLPAEAEADDPLGRPEGAALWPARFDLAALADIKQVLGRDYVALYQQRPQPVTGSLFQRDWFTRKTLRELPERENLGGVVQGWDTALEEGEANDYSACVTLSVWRNVYLVLDVWRGKVEYPALVRQIKEQAAKWGATTIAIENKNSGTSAIQTLRTETALPIVKMPATKDKVARANLVTGICEAQRVWIVQGANGDMLLDELLRFPTGRHDDLVDAFVHALTKISTAGARARVREY